MASDTLRDSLFEEGFIFAETLDLISTDIDGFDNSDRSASSVRSSPKMVEECVDCDLLEERESETWLIGLRVVRVRFSQQRIRPYFDHLESNHTSVQSVLLFQSWTIRRLGLDLSSFRP